MFRLTSLPLLTGLIPLITAHTTYLVSASQGHIPWCFPYFDSCSSISATGRYGASFYIFKGFMIPAACLMVVYWTLTYRWLLSLGDRPGFGSKSILVLGVIASLFFILYTVALGAGTEYFAIQRRIGIIFFFTLTFLSQLLLTYRLGKLLELDKTRPFQLFICYTLLGTGIFTLFLDAFLSNYDDYEDAFEWFMASLMHGYFLVTWYTWKQTGFEVSFSSSIRKGART